MWPPPAADRGGGAAGAEVDGGEVVAHLAGCVAAVVGVAQAELPVAVVAPALDGAVVEERAGVVAAGGDRGGGAAGAEVDGGEVVAHLAGLVAAVVGVAEAELAVAVVAPALDGAVVEQRAGVVVAGGDRGGGAAGAEVDGGKVVAHLAGLVAAVVGVAEAELAVVVVAPALDGAVVEQRAGVRPSRRDG